MASPNFSILFSVQVSGTASAGLAGDVLIPDATSGLYVLATAANRGTRRATGMAMSTYESGGAVEILQFGQTNLTRLGTGAASWVRVSAAGALERCTPAGSDDICGYVEADGTFHACFGFLTAAIVNGGGGGTPGGASGDWQKNSAGAFAGFTPAAGVETFVVTPTSANLAAAVTDETGSGSLVFGTAPLFKTTINLNNPANTFKYVITPAAIVADRTLTLPLLTAGDTMVCEAFTQTLTNKTINGASNTLTVRIANDVSGLGAGVATFLGTPSGANLASALTSALPESKGGTGVTALSSITTLLDSTTRIGCRGYFTDETTDATAGPATLNNYAIGDYGQLYVNNSAGTITFTGFAAPAAGEARDLVIIANQAAGFGFALSHDSASSTAANRIYVNGGYAGVALYCAHLRYCQAQSRWILIGAPL